MAEAAPIRIQLSRARGWRMPENTMKVDRTTEWGNMFSGGSVPASELVRLFRAYAVERLRGNPNVFEPLRGKNLACWCKPGEPCHADVLLELANSAVAGGQPKREQKAAGPSASSDQPARGRP